MIIEIIGPAGSGKSTLSGVLGKARPDFHQETLPPVWKFSHLGFYTRNLIFLIPTIFRLHESGGRNFSRQELAWMAILNGWSDLLIKKKGGGVPLFIDQGPIFLMAVLSGFGPQNLLNPINQSWWRKIYARWARTLDLVIWLDANDETLTRRIRCRESEHVMKYKTDLELRGFLGKYRLIYENLVHQLSTLNSIMRVIKIDTAQNSPGEVLNKVITEIERK